MVYRSNPIRWGNAGAGIMFFCENEVLLTLRSQHVQEPYTWGITGGAIGREAYTHTELDDSPDFALEDYWYGAVNETGEELFDGDLRPLESIKPFDRVRYQEGNFTYVTFLVRITAKQKRNWIFSCNWECDAHEWFAVDELPEDLHFGVEYIVDQRPELFTA